MSLILGVAFALSVDLVLSMEAVQPRDSLSSDDSSFKKHGGFSRRTVRCLVIVAFANGSDGLILTR